MSDSAEEPRQHPISHHDAVPPDKPISCRLRSVETGAIITKAAVTIYDYLM